MAFIFNGSGHIVRNSGGIAALETFTILLAVMRTSTQTGNRYLLTLRPGSESSGHNCILYNGAGGGDAAPILVPNYSGTIADPNVILPLDTWMWVAIIGNSTTLSILQYSGGSWVSASTTQTTFVPAILRLADSGTSADRLTCKISHVREWNRVFNTTELSAEIASSSPVITTNIVSAKTGTGADLAQALLGQIGTTFTASGTVTIDSDTPLFTTTADVAVAQTISDFSQVATVANINTVAVAQTLEDFAQVATFEAVNNAEASQTVEDFTQSVTATVSDPALEFTVSQALEDFSQYIHISKAVPAPPIPVYDVISCGPGEMGVPVTSGVRNLRREYHQRWPTK